MSLSNEPISREELLAMTANLLDDKLPGFLVIIGLESVEDQGKSFHGKVVVKEMPRGVVLGICKTAFRLSFWELLRMIFI